MSAYTARNNFELTEEQENQAQRIKSLEKEVKALKKLISQLRDIDDGK